MDNKMPKDMTLQIVRKLKTKSIKATKYILDRGKLFFHNLISQTKICSSTLLKHNQINTRELR